MSYNILLTEENMIEKRQRINIKQKEKKPNADYKIAFV